MVEVTVFGTTISLCDNHGKPWPVVLVVASAALVGEKVLQAISEQVPEYFDVRVRALLEEGVHPSMQAAHVEALLAGKTPIVAATWSPNVLSRVRREQVLLVRHEEGGPWTIGHPNRDPRLLAPSEVYAGWLGVNEGAPSSWSRQMSRYNYLRTCPERSTSETKEVVQLQRALTGAGFDIQPLRYA